MVRCEYCMHEVPKGEKRKTKYFLVLEAGTKIPLDEVEEYVKKHHHQIKVCKKCHDDIFVSHPHTPSEKSSPAPKKKSSPKKKVSRKKSSPAPKKKSSPAPKKKSSPKKK